MSHYKLVPVQPTDEMTDVGDYARSCGCSSSTIYTDMLIAAPDVRGAEASLEVTGRSDFPGYVICVEINGYGATLGDKLYTAPQPAEQKEPDSLCVEDDGCPTERAVLQRFWRKHHQPELDVSALVEALEEIIHPVRFMQERLEEGERLNGMAAVQLAEDASYLREIAIAALATYHNQKDNNQ